MGGQCSARLAREGPGCVRLPPIGHCQEHCDPCDDGDHADLTTEHPLLLRRQQELQGQDSTPRTPRGPEPPWAQHGGERRDRTATGATPPRSPTPPRSVPPGLPPEDAPAIESVITLAGSFGTDFVEELFRFVRKGDMANITTQIQRVNHAAFSLMGGPGGFANGNMSASDRSEGAAELTAELLNKVREGSSGSTLLGAAAESGHVLATHALLLHKADPAIADAKGNTPLHKAAQTGSLLTSLVLLDRLQSNDRSASIAALANADGETPETAAATAAAAGANVELYHAFEVYQKMQKDAQHRQLGSVLASDPTGHRISTGDAVALVDLAVEVPSAAEANAAALLRRCCVGTALVPNLFQRIPDDQEQLAALVERVCSGLRTAEDFLRRQHWDPSDPGLDPALRSLVATADLRSQWQKIRAQAISSKKGALCPAPPVRCSSGDRDGMRKAAGWLDISKQNRWPQASLQHCWSKGDARTVSCRKSSGFFVSQLCAPAFLAEVSC
ncbi:unnamed protein product [Effrenium voratum]|nr:unnamed protein product [Effrenium voratum]